MDIRNIDDLSKAISEKTGGIVASTNADVNKLFKEECNRLKEYIVTNMEKYIMSYHPTVYEPTGQWYDSLERSEITYTSLGNKLIAKIDFIDELAWHNSWLYPGDESQMGYTPWLMEKGWEWNKAPKGGHIYRFTKFDGIHYVLEAVQKFYRNNPYKLHIDVYFGSELYIYNGNLV